VDMVWTPTPDIVYPQHFQTAVSVNEVSQPLEGASRSGHFQGVATVVAKLFNIFQPRYAYFGQKDAQQVVVLKRMVADLNFNLEIVVCPTIREANGLAMSSRNARIAPELRLHATCLFEALEVGKTAVFQGIRDAEEIRQRMEAIITATPHARLDYVSVADPTTLVELGTISDEALLSLAVYLGEVRLIDNIIATVRAGQTG
ncbi:MAG: pantoate--beta-alanine ligase, partial [Chloroflexota bacterium]